MTDISSIGCIFTPTQITPSLPVIDWIFGSCNKPETYNIKIATSYLYVFQIENKLYYCYFNQLNFASTLLQMHWDEKLILILLYTKIIVYAKKNSDANCAYYMFSSKIALRFYIVISIKNIKYEWYLEQYNRLKQKLGCNILNCI